jgi:hypothetical protein
VRLQSGVRLTSAGRLILGTVREFVSQLENSTRQARALRVLERSIAAFVESCDNACVGGPGPDCVILSDLGSLQRGGLITRRGCRA